MSATPRRTASSGVENYRKQKAQTACLLHHSSVTSLLPLGSQKGAKMRPFFS